MQVALKVGEFEIIRYLLEQGADFETWLDGGSLLGQYTNRECYWNGISSKVCWFFEKCVRLFFINLIDIPK